MPRKRSLFECARPTIYFKDGKRSVDFVLVWDSSDAEATSDEAQSRREMFESNLKEEGLELELESFEPNSLQFIKVHKCHM